MESPLVLASIPASATPLPEQPKQGKFSKEEIDCLKTHLPAYVALCHQLEERETGPGSVKGRKKNWILSEVYPKFVTQFLSDQSGGPQLQSLQEVSCLLWHSILAETVVENSAMVYEPLTSSDCFPASACHQRC